MISSCFSSRLVWWLLRGACRAAPALPIGLLVLVACGGSNPSSSDQGYDPPTEDPTGVGRIVFIGEDASLKYHLFFVNFDGRGVTKLTIADPRADYTGPFWSPDGTKLAFASNLGGDADYDIYTINADGTGLRAIVDDPHGKDFAPAWSPDGQTIAYQSKQLTSNGWDIILVDVDGTNVRNITSFPGDEQLPAWSPDGAKIALQWTYGGGTDIYVMDADGTNRTRLTPGGGVVYAAPAWSPDGTRIAYESNRHQDQTGGLEFGQYEIYVMDADGTNSRRVTSESGSGTALRFPTWSPDASQIAYEYQWFDRNGSARARVRIVSIDGSTTQDIPNLPVFSRFPRWSPTL